MFNLLSANTNGHNSEWHSHEQGRLLQSILTKFGLCMTLKKYTPGERFSSLGDHIQRQGCK